MSLEIGDDDLMIDNLNAPHYTGKPQKNLHKRSFFTILSASRYRPRTPAEASRNSTGGECAIGASGGDHRWNLYRRALFASDTG